MTEVENVEPDHEKAFYVHQGMWTSKCFSSATDQKTVGWGRLYTILVLGLSLTSDTDTSPTGKTTAPHCPPHMLSPGSEQH